MSETRPLFPSLEGSIAAKVSLNDEAKHYLASRPAANQGNPLLRYGQCSQMVEALHRRLGVNWSWGGYLEDRSFFLQGSYLEDSGNFLHLGIDCNVPADSPVSLPLPSTVLMKDDDHDDNLGWGPRLVLECREPSVVYILAHLQDIRVEAGVTLPAGEIIAAVGEPPANGGWFPHLHIQCIRPALLPALRKDDFRQLDGYGNPRDLERLKGDYPDPTFLLSRHLN